MIVELRRTLIAPDGAFGMLVVKNVAICLSLERTFEPTNKIVIPPGDHPCIRDFYHGGGYETFLIQVQGSGIKAGRVHKRVLLHAANYEDQLEGCVATGTRFIWYKGKRGIGASKQAHTEFMKVVENVEGFTLRVTNP